MNKREFLAAFLAGAVVTAEGLWFPGTKLISIPAVSLPWYDVLDCGNWRRVYVDAAASAMAVALDKDIVASLSPRDLKWFSVAGLAPRAAL